MTRICLVKFPSFRESRSLKRDLLTFYEETFFFPKNDSETLSEFSENESVRRSYRLRYPRNGKVKIKKHQDSDHFGVTNTWKQICAFKI